MAKPANKAASAPRDDEQEQEQKGGALAPREAGADLAQVLGAAPDFLVEQAARRAAEGGGPLGVSQERDDNLVPLVYVLQSNSPQVLRTNRDKYIEGAAAGDIWLRNALTQIVRGDEGVAFQPCYFSRDVVEWKLDRGGFVGRHGSWEALGADPTGVGGDVVEQPHPRDQTRMIKVRKSTGNQLVDTRYHSGFVVGGFFGLQDFPTLALPYVIPLSSTGHQFSREWTFAMNQMIVPGSNPPVVADSFSRIYRLVTVGKSNRLGDWFGWKVAGSTWVKTEAEYARGRALFDSFARGEKRVEDAEGGAAEGVGASGDGGGKV